MTINKYIALAVTTIWTMSSFGQDGMVGLSIGDSLPNFIIPKIINFKYRSVNTAEFKNKLLIVDFWSRGCGSCIEALPKMDLLNKKFEGNVEILPVTYEREKEIKDFLKTNKYTKKLNISSVVEDNLFRKYFKHRYIPHEIWIYKGKIIGITTSEYVDEFNIKRVLNNETIDWVVKNDFYSFNRSKPLFKIDSLQVGANAQPVQYVAISGYRQKSTPPIWLSGGAGIDRDSTQGTVRAFFLNQPILNTYLVYWNKLVKFDTLIKPYYAFQPNQVLWKVRSKSRYIYEKKLGTYSQEWMIKNSICFESVYPNTGQTDNQIYHSIILDLNRLLGVDVKWEKRREKVLVLQKAGPTIPTKHYKGVKMNIYQIVFNLNEQPTNPYVFNETGAEDTELPINVKSWTDLSTINKELGLAGYILREKYKDVHKLIFMETDGGRFLSDK